MSPHRPPPTVLRPHAETQYAAELGRAGRRSTTGRGRRTGTCRRGPSSRTSSAGVLADGTADRAQVRRPAPAGRDRRGHAGHRPGAAPARRAGHGQDVGQRAPRRRHQRRLDAARPGHGRHDRGVAALRLELRPAAGRGPERGGARPQPGVPGDAHRPAGAHRGADPHAVGGAGRAGHDPVGEGAAGARAGHRGRRRRRASTSSPRPTTATVGSTSCPARCAGASTPSCCRCRRRPRRRWRSSPSGSPSSGTALALPEVPADVRRDPPGRHHLPRAARGRHGRRAHEPQDADRHAVDGRGDLRGHQRPGPRRPLRRRRRCARATSPAASSAPSCATRCTTRSPGGSTSRGWSAIATAGATSTTPAASSPDHGTGPAGGARGCTCSGSATTGRARRARCARALDASRPDVGAGRGAGRRRRRAGLDRPPRARPAGRPARLRRRPPGAGRVRPARRVQPGVAGRLVGRRPRRRVRAIDLPLALAFGRLDDPAPALAVGRRAAARPARRAGRGGRRARPRALVGGPRRAPRRRRAGVRRRRRGDGRRPRPGTVTPPFDALREAHMRRRIRAAAGRRTTSWPSSAAPGTCRRSTRPSATAAADAAALRGRPKVKVAVTWVPWTHRRLGRSTGYGAGVASPGWYAHVFRHPGPEGVSRFFVDAAHALRRHGHAGVARPPHRRVRGWPRRSPRCAAGRGPGLAEVLDAADAVLGGLAARPRRARRRRRHRRGAARGAAGPAGPRPRRVPSGRPG